MSRMPSIGRRCHELRINDADKTWRIVYRLDSDAIIVAAIFPKTTQKTPRSVIDDSKRRLRHYDEAVKAAREARKARRKRPKGR
jgi:phage-related protein